MGPAPLDGRRGTLENGNPSGDFPLAPAPAYRPNRYCIETLILAVQAEGNYVSLRPRTNPYLVHESLSFIAEKLKPYGFYSHPPLGRREYFGRGKDPTFTDGEYRLRVKGGKEYLVTRTYKHNLRDLAQLWVGSERLCG